MITLQRVNVDTFSRAHTDRNVTARWEVPHNHILQLYQTNLTESDWVPGWSRKSSGRTHMAHHNLRTMEIATIFLVFSKMHE